MSYYVGGAAGTWIGGLAYEGGGWGGTVAAMIAVQALAGCIAWSGWRDTRSAELPREK